MTLGPLLFRADASVAIGTGHVMRCLALAQAWQDAGGTAVFAVAELPPATEQRLLADGLFVARIDVAAGSSADADATAALAQKHSASWLIVDGDRFSPEFVKRAKASSRRLLLIDDFARRDSSSADLILNPNMGAGEAPYRNAGSVAPLLLGESYVMLRREFVAWRGQRSYPDKATNILVTLGGSDPENLTPRITRALTRLPGYHVTAVTGPGNPNRLEDDLAPNLRVVFNPENLCELMAGADIAVIAAGGTLWELLHMGCATLSYARNSVQSGIVESVAARGAVLNLGFMAGFQPSALNDAVEDLAQSEARREQMSIAGRRLIDGKGARRVVEKLLQLGGTS